MSIAFGIRWFKYKVAIYVNGKYDRDAAVAKEGLHHAMIITKIENGKIYISAHSNDHINAEINNDFFQDGNIDVIVRM